MKNFIKIILLISTILVYSCRHLKESDESKFKSAIGIENFNILNHCMKQIEQKFMINYEVTNLNDAYNSYLGNKFLGESHLKFDESDCHLYHSIMETDLINEWIKQSYDKIYEEDNIIVTVSDGDTSWLVKPPESFEGEYKDKVKEEGYYMQVNPPLYEALKFADNRDNLLSIILKAKKYDGLINTESIMTVLALEKINYEEEFLYRLIVCFEIYLTELKEYGC